MLSNVIPEHDERIDGLLTGLKRSDQFDAFKKFFCETMMTMMKSSLSNLEEKEMNDVTIDPLSVVGLLQIVLRHKLTEGVIPFPNFVNTTIQVVLAFYASVGGEEEFALTFGRQMLELCVDLINRLRKDKDLIA